MPDPVTTAKVIDRSQATVTPDRVISQIVVDPGYDSSFTIDLKKMREASVKVDPRHKMNGVSRDEALVLALRSMQTSEAPVKSTGRAIPTIDGGNHSHPDAQLPANVVAPPQVRVHFDIPGYASLLFRYHSVKRVDPGYLVFVTDKRYAGGAEFYPYTAKMAAENSKPMGAYVEGGKRMYLLKPGSIVFQHEPFEFCLVPIAEDKPLPPELSRTVSSQEDLQVPVTEDLGHGEARSDRGGADPSREVDLLIDTPDDKDIDIGRIDFTAGGGGGVL